MLTEQQEKVLKYDLDIFKSFISFGFEFNESNDFTFNVRRVSGSLQGL